MDEVLIEDDLDILDKISINGRVSKKLFNKVVRPQLEELYVLQNRVKVLERQMKCNYLHNFTVSGFYCNKCGWSQPTLDR
jgi:hypothetical protein